MNHPKQVEEDVFKTVVDKWLTKLTLLSKFIPPEYRSKLPYLAALFLISPRLSILLFIVGAAFLAGNLWKSTEQEEIDSLKRIHAISSRFPLPKDPINDYDKTKYYDNLSVEALASVSHPLNVEIDELISFVLRDFVLFWFDSLNASKRTDFPDAIRKSLKIGIVKFGYLASQSPPVSLAMRLFERFILHLREFREFENLAIPLEVFVASNPDCHFARIATEEHLNTHLSILAKYIIKRIIPRADSSSPIILSFLDELISSTLLKSFIDKIADPDYINRYIVDNYQASADEKNAFDSASPFWGGLDLDFKEFKEELSSILKNPMGSKSSIHPVQIYVKVLEARRVPTTGLSSSLFCQVLVGKESRKTKKVGIDSNPLWIDDFNFDWKSDSHKGVNGIVIDLYNSSFLQNELLGSVYIPKDSLVPNKFVKEWYPLSDSDFFKDNYVGGAIHAELKIECMLIVTEFMNDLEDDDEPLQEKRSSGKMDVSVEGSPRTNDLAPDLSLSPEGHIDKNLEIEFPSNESAKQPEIPYITPEPTKSPQIASDEVPSIVSKLRSIFNNPEALKEFSSYTASIKEPMLTQLFSNAISFEQIVTPSSEYFISDSRSLEKDLVQFYDHFLSKKNPKIRSYFEDTEPEILQKFQDTANNCFGTSEEYPVLFAELKEALLRIIAIHFATGFFKSVYYEHCIALFSGIEKQQSAAKFMPGLPHSDDEEEDDENVIIEGRNFKNEMEDGGLPFLVATLSSLKEQILIIDLKMDGVSNKKLKNLMKSKMNLQLQVQQISELIEHQQRIDAEGLNDSNMIQKHTKLKGLKIMVTDVTEEDDWKSHTASNPTLFKNKQQPLTFVVEMERLDGSNGWMKTIQFADFKKLNQSLCASFPKVSKLTFPELPKSNSAFNQDNLTQEFSRHIRENIAHGLEKWLGMLLSDTLLCEANALQTFLRPSSVSSRSVSKPAQSSGSKIFGAFKNASKRFEKSVVAGVGAVTAGVDAMVDFTTGINSAGSKNGSKDVLEYHRHSIETSPRKSTTNSFPARSESLSNANKDNRVSFESTMSDVSSPKTPVTPANKNTPSRSITPSEEQHFLSKDELEIILECIFASVEEIFNMSNPNQWMRQKGLSVVKTFLRRAYAPTIRNYIQTGIKKIKNEDSLIESLRTLKEEFWPNGKWKAAESISATQAVETRTQEQMEETKLLAKNLFTSGVVFSSESINNIVGKQNAKESITRFFNMLQYKQLNRHLCFMVIDCFVKSVLADAL